MPAAPLVSARRVLVGPRRAAVRAGVTVVAVAALALGAPAAASAHSLESSTVSVHVTDTGVDARVTIATATLEEALGTDVDVATDPRKVLAYLDATTTVTGADGTAWTETWSDLTTETVEGIDSVTALLTLDPGTGYDPDTTSFTLTYDAVLGDVAGHEAVVVLTDTDGEVSTAGVLTADSDALTIGPAGAVTRPSADDSPSTGAWGMVRLGYHHVLEGADHLLFLLALLLPAPLVLATGRWSGRATFPPSLRRVLAVATAFTVGHSVTLIAATLGWVTLPTTLVEVLVATSVGVAAVHAIRPLVRGGEVAIAGGFGLVHGFAFAGILAGLGLDGTSSVPSLLAFNVGVELAQLTAVAATFPALFTLSRTRAYRTVRVGGATVALTAATAWALDRLGLLTDPFAAIEATLVAHLWVVTLALALAAVGALVLERRSRATIATEPEAVGATCD